MAPKTFSSWSEVVHVCVFVRQGRDISLRRCSWFIQNTHTHTFICTCTHTHLHLPIGSVAAFQGYGGIRADYGWWHQQLTPKQSIFCCFTVTRLSLFDWQQNWPNDELINQLLKKVECTNLIIKMIIFLLNAVDSWKPDWKSCFALTSLSSSYHPSSYLFIFSLTSFSTTLCVLSINHFSGS